MKFNEDYNDIIEEDLEKLSKFDHVECFDILVEEIMALKDNEQFIQMLKEIKKYSKNINKINEIKATINILTEKGLTKIEYYFDFNTPCNCRRYYLVSYSRKKARK